jgi:prophage regulatory protein
MILRVDPGLAIWVSDVFPGLSGHFRLDSAASDWSTMRLLLRRFCMLAALPAEIVEAKPVVRRQQLRELVPLADTTIYEMEQRGDFPKRFYLTPRCPVWDLGEINHWLAARRAVTGLVSPPHPDVRRRKARPVRV